MKRGLEFTINTIATTILLLLAALFIIIMFTTHFTENTEPLESLTQDANETSYGVDTSLVLAKFRLCPNETQYDCFEPAPFDNIVCAGSSGPYPTLKNCVGPCARISMDNTNTYYDTGNCYCRCIKK